MGVVNARVGVALKFSRVIYSTPLHKILDPPLNSFKFCYPPSFVWTFHRWQAISEADFNSQHWLSYSYTASSWLHSDICRLIFSECDPPWQNQPYCPQIVFESRPPLPNTTLELLLPQISEVSSPHTFGDMSQKFNVPGSPVQKLNSKHNERLPHTLHAEVCILAVYENSWPRPNSQ